MTDNQQAEGTHAGKQGLPEQAGTDTAPAQETDWKAEARKWEDRAKANKARAAQFEAQLSDLQGAASDAEKLTARVKALEDRNASLEHGALVSEVAAAKGVDPGLLAGSTRQELEAYAEKLLAWRGEPVKQAAAPALGYQPSTPEISATQQVVRNLFNKE